MRTACPETCKTLVETPSGAPRLPARPWLERLTLGALSAATSALVLGAVVVPMSALVLPSTAHAAPVAPADGDVVPALQLQRFALNALLVPVLDEGQPARFTRTFGAMRCGAGTQAWVNGKPMRGGAPVPSQAFTLRWKLVDCRPMNRNESYDGDVSMTVYHEDGGYSSTVVPVGLRVTTPDSSAVWKQTFAVVMR